MEVKKVLYKYKLKLKNWKVYFTKRTILFNNKPSLNKVKICKPIFIRNQWLTNGAWWGATQIAKIFLCGSFYNVFPSLLPSFIEFFFAYGFMTYGFCTYALRVLCILLQGYKRETRFSIKHNVPTQLSWFNFTAQGSLFHDNLK